MQNKLRIGCMLYIVALIFSSSSVFFQVLPLDTSDHFQQSLGISASDVVYLTSLYFVTYAIMQIPAGILLDRYGLDYILPLSIFITTIGCVLYWNSSTSFMLGFSRLITGVGCSAAYISGIFVAVKFLSPKWLPLFIGLVESISTSGSIVAAKPLSTFLDKFGWHTTATVVSSFCVLLFALSVFCVINIEYYIAEKPKTTIVGTFISAFKLLRNKTLLAIFAYSFSTWLIIMSFAGFWLKDYLIFVHEYSESMALNFVEIYWGSFIVSSLILSLLVKNFRSARIYVLALAFLGCATYIVMAAPIVFNYAGTATVVILGGVSATGVIIAFSIVPNTVEPEQSGTVIAMNNVFIVLGGYAGQLLFGYVLKHIDIANIATNYDFKSLETHYYTALLIYPIFALIALVSITYALSGKRGKVLSTCKW